MSHARHVLIALAVLGVGSAYSAGVPPTTCGRAEVLDVVADDIARGGRSSVIVPGDIGEIPTAIPGTVRCAVHVDTRFFDTNRYGFVPQIRRSIVEFTVRAGQNGLFVDDIGTPR